MRRPALVALLLALHLTGCPGDARDGRGAPAVQPASDEARCEHGVLGAVCPKCHPKLAPVFQAKGDWCAEHGFAESFCPICHPERGGRPGVDVSAKRDGKPSDGKPSDGKPSDDDKAPPADGTKVHLKTQETAQIAGIRTAKAEERTSEGGVLVTARLAYDAARLAHVNARSPGVVRRLVVDLGARVKKGAPLAVVDSAEVGEDRSRLRAAEARVDAAQKNYDRQKLLHDEGINAAKAFEAAEAELAAAKAERAGIAAALSVAGARAGSGASYTLDAPLDGVVAELRAAVGKHVGPDELLFAIVDPSRMWAELDVPEDKLASAALGQAVIVAIDALPGRTFQGTIDALSPAVDPHTRTVRARVPLANPDGALRGNMYGRARLSEGGARAAVMVPDAAVQRAKDVYLVFLRLADDTYEARHVQIGRRDDGFVEITQGLRPGDEVVTTGSFLLKTETLKGSIGAGCCDAD